MFFLKAAFCRVFQTAFRIALPFLPYREPQIVNTCAELGTVFRVEKIKSVLIVTDKGIVNNGLSVCRLDESVEDHLILVRIRDREVRDLPADLLFLILSETELICRHILEVAGDSDNHVVVLILVHGRAVSRS